MNDNGLDKQIKRWQRDIVDGRMTRRQFLAAASAAGLAAGAPLLYEDARAATPQKGGMINIGIAHGSTTDSADPGTWENDFTISLGHTTNCFLTEIDENNQLIGELAESYEPSADVRMWTIKLRSGVTFHNGKDMTAADVIASINFHRGEDSASAARIYMDQIADMKADGKHVVVFTLKEGNADFPYFLSDYHLPIKPASGDSIDYKSLDSGCGAYILTSWEPGVSAKYKRNPNYWKEGRAHFDGGSMIAIADVTARTNALTTGEVNMIDRVDTKTTGRLAKHPRVTVEETSGNGHYSFPMRSHLAPFDDNNVRLALKYALDREEMLKKVLSGHGYIGNDTPIGRGNAYVATEEELPQKKYDPDRAKHYLKQSGLSSLTVELASAEAAFGGAVDAAVLFQENARAAGITIDVARVPDDGYWSNVWNTDNYKWSACYWSGRPTEDLMFSVSYAAGADWNDSNWNHARFNDLLKQARVETKTGLRRELYVEMQRIVSDEGAVMVPVFNNFIHAIAKDEIAHNEQMASNWALDGQRYAERWWHL